MHLLSISIPDEAYALVEERAQEEGFSSAEQFLAEFITANIGPAEAGIDHLFTPRVIAHLDQVAEQADGGMATLTSEEITERLRRTKAKWQTNPSGSQ